MTAAGNTPTPDAHSGFAQRHAEASSGDERDMTPALGARGGPGSYERAEPGARVALHVGRWEDGRWSYLFDKEAGYAPTQDDDLVDRVAAANRRAREGDLPPVVQGPVLKSPVWTWEVPLYFWFGGIAAGSSFVALACDLSGDHRSARIARLVALGALVPSPPLLISDLGRPERFYNMLRVFKPRSPMNMGAWALTAFGGLASAAVGADLLGQERVARLVGGTNVIVGGYLGSYAGVLLACTAVPVWSRSRLFLGPIFVATAAASGAAACRFALVLAGVPEGDHTRRALGRVETGAMAIELVLSSWNEHRLGRLKDALETGRPGRVFKGAKWAVRAGLALSLARGRGGPVVHHVASALYLGAGLAFRYAWVSAGPPSARDDEAVARTHRGRATGEEPGSSGATSVPAARSR